MSWAIGPRIRFIQFDDILARKQSNRFSLLAHHKSPNRLVPLCDLDGDAVGDRFDYQCAFPGFEYDQNSGEQNSEKGSSNASDPFPRGRPTLSPRN